jgi:hypothetical protein
MGKKKQKTKVSYGMGIASIAVSWLSPGISIALAIIGFSVKKGKYDRDILLNTIGFILGLIFFAVYWLYY